MNSRELICHPGPESARRMVSALGDVVKQSGRLPAGQNLLKAVADMMDNVGCDSGLVVLDGVHIGPFDYVMPDASKDDVHAAWYSDTHSCSAALLRNATAIVGRRDGAWWLHCHAIWDADDDVGMGHLLPDDVTLGLEATVTFYAFTGGQFDVALDSETAFPLFHVHGERTHGNAFIAKIYPHVDIHTAIERLIVEAGFTQASVFGIGSLIGTRFENAEPMTCPISEVLIGPGATWKDNTLTLPMHCVDLDGNRFFGTVVKGGAPVTVTFELMVVEQ